MKKKMKSLLCMLVVLVMMVTTVGCGGGKSGKGGNTETDAGFATESKESFLDVLSSGEYTVAIKLVADETEINLEGRVKDDEFQLAGDVVLPSGDKMDCLLGWNAEEIQLALPFASDDVFVYNFVEDKDGFIAEYAESVGFDLGMIDSLLKQILASEASEAMADELETIITDAIESWSGDEVTATYEIDGEDRECKGTVYTLDGYDFMDFCEDIMTVVLEQYEDILEYTMLVSVDDLVDEMFSDMDDEGLDEVVSVVVYTYDEKLAAIVFEAEEESIELRVKGYDTTIPSMEFVENGEVVGALEVSKEGTQETYAVVDSDGERMEIAEYNTKSGELVISNPEDSSQYVKLIVKCDSEEFFFALDELKNIDGVSEDVQFEISITKGASIKKLSGNKIDLGNATMNELMEAVEPFVEVISDLMNATTATTEGLEVY